MELVSRGYRYKNGMTIFKARCYTGVDYNYFFVVFNKAGEIAKSCFSSYESAANFVKSH